MRRIRWSALLAVLLLLSLLFPGGLSARTQPLWSRISGPDLVANDRLIRILHDGEQYIAVSAGGVLLTSPDGLAWAARKLPFDHPVVAAAVLNGKLTVLTRQAGDAQEFKVWNSYYLVAKGEILQRVEGPSGVQLDQLWVAGDQLVSMGAHIWTNEAYAYLSTDGRRWEYQSAGWQDYPQTVGTDGSYQYGYANFQLFRRSRSGGSWKHMTRIPPDQAPARITSIVYGNGRFVALGVDHQGEPWVRSSTTGENWEATNLPAKQYDILLFAAGNFLAVGDGLYAASRDGARWSLEADPAMGRPRSLIHRGGWVTAVGDSGLILQGRLSDILRSTGQKPAAPVPSWTGAQCAGFIDMLSTDPACAPVAKLLNLSVVSGYPDKSFRPGDKVTRAAFAKMLVLALERKPEPGGTVTFNDVAGHWAVAQGYVQAAVAMGAMGGFPDGSFRPDEPVTRAQMVKATMASAGLRAAPATFYQDIKGTWYEPFVAEALGGRVVGSAAPYKLFTEPRFQGDRDATRAETAIFLANLFD